MISVYSVLVFGSSHRLQRCGEAGLDYGTACGQDVYEGTASIYFNGHDVLIHSVLSLDCIRKRHTKVSQ